MAKRHTRVVRQVGGPHEYRIEDAETRYGLKALNRNVLDLQTRFQAKVAAAEEALRENQALFMQKCQTAATALGIDISDQSLSLRFDDEKGAFIVTPKNAAGSPQEPAAEPEVTPESDESEEDADAESEADA